MSRRILFLVIALCLVFSQAASLAYAQDDNQDTGVVDLQKVWEKAPRGQQYDEELREFQLGLTKKIDIRAQNLMLSDEEIKELIELMTKEQTTEAESARLQELQSLDRDRDKELKDLQVVASPNDEQKARLKTLQDMQKKSTETMQSIDRDYQEQIATKAEEYRSQFIVEIEEAIKAVAEEKKMKMVFDSMAALYGGTDITDDVIGKLDRKVK